MHLCLPLPHLRDAFYSWLARHPCICCGARPVHLHHVTVWGLPRRGHALQEFTVLPVCAYHHQTGPHAAHRMKQVRWLLHYGTDLEATLLAQYRGYAAAHGLGLPGGLTAREAAAWLVAAPG